MLTESEIAHEFAIMREELAELEYNRWIKQTLTGSLHRPKPYKDLYNDDKAQWRKMADEDLAMFDLYVKRVIAGYVKE